MVNIWFIKFIFKKKSKNHQNESVFGIKPFSKVFRHCLETEHLLKGPRDPLSLQDCIFMTKLLILGQNIGFYRVIKENIGSMYAFGEKSVWLEIEKIQNSYPVNLFHQVSN